MIKGCFRLGLFLSAIWLVLLAAFVVYENSILKSGESAMIGLVLIEDLNSGEKMVKSFSMAKFERLKELYRQEIESDSEAQDEDLEAKLAMRVGPKVQLGKVILFFLVPCSIIMFLTIGLGWVVQGFLQTSKT